MQVIKAYEKCWASYRELEDQSTGCALAPIFNQHYRLHRKINTFN